MSGIKKSWSYEYPLTKRFDWIVTTIILMLITDAIIAFALFLADTGNFIGTLKECSFVFWIIFGVYALACLMILIMGGGKYWYSYVLTDTELIMLRNPEEIMALNHEMTVNQRIGSHVDLRSVTKLTLVGEKNEIRVRGKLIHTTV